MQAGRRRMAKVVLGVLVLVAVAFALRPRPVPAEIVTVERGLLRVTIDEEGETRVRHRYVISAPLPGRMLRINLEPGDPVSAGKTVLATFQPADPALLDVRTRSELEARVQAARAALERVRAERDRARTDLGFARRELERYRELESGGIASRERREVAERQVQTQEEALRAADFAVQTAEYELKVAQAGLLQVRAGGAVSGRPIELRSPIDGVILRRRRESEAIVPAGEPLLEVADLADLEIVSDLLSTDAARVRPGMRVLIERWGGHEVLEGRVRRIEPSGFTKISALGVEEQRVNVIVEFADRAEAAALGDGYRVEVRIVEWEQESTVKVPTSSLFRHEDRWAVYAVTGNKAELRPVEIGQRTSLEAEVRSGLGEGDLIIAYPSDAVADGVSIVARGN